MLTRLESAVELQFERPANFDRFKAAYIYINVPWISKYEWHAFTVYENPNDPDLMSLCIAKNGDWTNKLHEAVKQPVVRPTWVLGPFDSPFRETGNYDHIFVIASGIGITPSVSIMNSYNRTRRVYLLWSIRDASLAEWFLDSIQFDDDSWNIIFYTGKRELVLGRKLPANVLILKGRPNLEKTIISIIQAVEHGVPLPADDDDDDEGSDHLGDEFAQEMKRLLLTYNKHELWDIVLGYENLQDKSATEVTLESITMMTTRLFKNPEKFSDDVLSEKFELLDTSKDSHLSYNEFKVYLDSLSDTFTKGSQGVPSARKSKSEFKEYLKDVALSKRAAKNDVIELADIETSRLTLDSVQLPQVSEGITTQSHWAMAYCGGVQPIVDQLKEISENHGISLDIEKFDW